ncbi:VaFE repeat-containing surface-anchored protein [Anaerofustis stercorihominis]|uniref:VaFE repeat-containing surface-anchored protein n=1 Tax=Anaerofustis stercorihominis TaxID=214853 RepID=UPI00210DF6DF|nr:VaFE repeat-containing surface-anchored protein [Anaerofustis stercorihominis]MCQ4794141.1 VaFE repeat-containing surface-anchored protein [Anaerofustis stercorihominis]
MQNIMSRGKRRVLAIFLCLAVFAGCMPFNASKAYAADGTVTYQKGEEIFYGTHFTHKMYVDGSTKNVAYCTEPSKAAPDDGKHSYTLLAQDSIYRKVLYYLPGGYGYETVTNAKYFKGWSDTDAYVIGHLIVSYIHDGYSMKGDAFTGASQKYIEKTKEVLDIIDEDLPKPPDSFKAFIIKIDGKQDIVGSWYKQPLGWIEIQKSDANPIITQGNPNYSLKGAKYGIYKSGTLVETLTTDAKGYAKSGELLEGNYTIKEISSSKGFALDTKGYNVNVTADKTIATAVKEVPQNNPMNLVLEKIDAETQKHEAQGKATLEGAEFKVEFYSVSSGQAEAEEPDRTWIFKTDMEGKIRFDKEHLVSGDKFFYQSDGKTICLPLGKVVITETKAPEGYLPLDGKVTLWITSEGSTETVKTYNAPIAAEQVKRGDLEFVKVSDGDLSRLAGVPFKITSLTTGESHTIVTDANGYASTVASWNKHTHNTNEGKTAEDGIWFGESKPDNSEGALIYDDYEIEELQCTANEGMNLIKFKVSVYKDNVTIPLGTLTDDRIEIGTTAKDGDTDSHFGKPEGKVTIIDTVNYDGLKKGETYKLTGTLMNKDTGGPIMENGKPVTAEKSFVARQTSGIVEVEFKVDSSALKGKSVVVFEDLYQNDIKLAVHADIEDEGQSVYYPEIGTTAKDADTGSHFSIAGKEVSIVDTVHYKGLQAGKTYKLTGMLMDKETGKSLVIKDKEVTVTKEFTAEKMSGEVDLIFTFDASSLDGKEVVVFEKLYKGNKELAVHIDINDKGQTVSFPEIGTTAKDEVDGDKTLDNKGEVTIVDTVKYQNLIPGKEYTVKGILMDKETGKALKIDGKEIVSESTFNAKKSAGTVDVKFTFDAKGLDGKNIVVFEKAYYAGTDIEVANHEDISDKGQTVKVKEDVPFIPNSPKTGDDVNIIPWIILLIAVGTVITAIRIRSRIKADQNIGQQEEKEE